MRDKSRSFGFLHILRDDIPVSFVCSDQKVSKSCKLPATRSPVTSVIPVSDTNKDFSPLIAVTTLRTPASPTLFPLKSSTVKNLILLATILQVKAVILLFLISNYLIFVKVDMIGNCLIMSSSVMLRLFKSALFVLRVKRMYFHS
jgi:hypothetical protein